MEKYKFRSTVYLVFLLVSLFINCVLLYMLIFENNKPIIVENNNDNHDTLVSDANKVYEDAYNLFNGDNSNFYVNEYENKLESCDLINFNGLENYFTNKAVSKLAENLIIENGNYYDCENKLKAELSYGLFGTYHQRVRTLNYVASSDDTLVVYGKLDYDGSVNNDTYPLYMIFKLVHNKWLIDYFE